MNTEAEIERHYRALERMYTAAPINEYYRPDILVSEGKSEICMDIAPKFFHAANAVHGSVYFKMLDDAAWFAVNSLITDVYVLTASFTTRLTRPVSEGQMKAIGTVIRQESRKIYAEARVYNLSGEEIGQGEGVFIRSKLKLSEATGYRI